MDISLSGYLLVALLLFGHVVTVAVVALISYAGLNIARLQPDIRYLFWPTFLGGLAAWGYTAKKILTEATPFHWWWEKSLTWYAALALCGLILGIFLQRSKM
jgi:hypothetical protein